MRRGTRRSRGTLAPVSDTPDGISTGWRWGVASVGVTVLTVVSLFAIRRTQFMYDDMQHQLMPMYRELGLQLRSGDWPAVAPDTWWAGFIAGDPQYGIFNPLSLATYVGVSLFDDFSIAAALMAACYLAMVAAAGYALARWTGLRPPLAAAVAVGMGTSPYLITINASNWAPGLIGFAWFAVALAATQFALRSEHSHRRGGLIAMAIAIVLTCTAGWPHAIVALLASLICLIGLSANVGVAHRVQMGVVAFGALTIGTVPYVVASSYLSESTRQSGWNSNGVLGVDVQEWVQAVSPLVRAPIEWFQGQPVEAPLCFVALWLLPAVLGASRVGLRRALPWLVLASILVVLCAGPSQAGPVRWSFRFVPFALTAILIAAATLVEAAPLQRRPGAREIGAVAAVGLVALAVDPRPVPVVGTIIVTAAVLWLYGRREFVTVERRASLIAALSVLGVVLVVASDGYRPEHGPWVGPTTVSGPQQAYGALFEGRVLLVHDGIGSGAPGKPTMNQMPSGAVTVVLDGETINGYSPIAPIGLADEMCWPNLFSWTCGPDDVLRLFDVDPGTERLFIDLFGLDGVVVARGAMEQAFVEGAGPTWVAAGATEFMTRYEPITSPDRVFRTVGDVADFPAGSTVISRPWYPGARIIADDGDHEATAYRDIFVASDAPLTGSLAVRYSLPRRLVALAALVIGLAICAAGVIGRRQSAQPTSDGSSPRPAPSTVSGDSVED